MGQPQAGHKRDRSQLIESVSWGDCAAAGADGQLSLSPTRGEWPGQRVARVVGVHLSLNASDGLFCFETEVYLIV